MTKISALGQDSTPTTDDYMVTVDVTSLVTKRVTISDFLTLMFTPSSIPTNYRQGWLTSEETWSYSSWDSTNKTGVITVPTDATAKYSLGQRIRISQSTGGTKYGIITKIAATALTVYFGTDYTLNNETISSPYYSLIKAPFGFPLDPTKWTQLTTNTSSTLGASSLSTWANNSSISLSIPIGAWRVGWYGNLSKNNSSASSFGAAATLSTANNTESDATFTARALQGTSYTGTNMIGQTREGYIVLATAATYFLNIEPTTTGGTVTTGFDGSIGTTKVWATCAYL